MTATQSILNDIASTAFGLVVWVLPAAVTTPYLSWGSYHLSYWDLHFNYFI